MNGALSNQFELLTSLKVKDQTGTACVQSRPFRSSQNRGCVSSGRRPSTETSHSRLSLEYTIYVLDVLSLSLLAIPYFAILRQRAGPLFGTSRPTAFRSPGEPP